MGIMVYPFIWVMQDLYHQPSFSSAAAASVTWSMSCLHCCSIRVALLTSLVFGLTRDVPKP